MWRRIFKSWLQKITELSRTPWPFHWANPFLFFALGKIDFDRPFAVFFSSLVYLLRHARHTRLFDLNRLHFGQRHQDSSLSKGVIEIIFLLNTSSKEVSFESLNNFLWHSSFQQGALIFTYPLQLFLTKSLNIGYRKCYLIELVTGK